MPSRHWNSSAAADIAILPRRRARLSTTPSKLAPSGSTSFSNARRTQGAPAPRVDFCGRLYRQRLRDVAEDARYALSWGAARLDESDFIGKFGFGLPNASINQTQLVEVYTKTADATAITRATLDIQRVKQFDATKNGPTEECDLPPFVQRHLENKSLSFDHGTVVVWVKPDRLSYRTPANMREHLVDDFGVTPADEAAWLKVNDRISVHYRKEHLLVTNRGPREEGYTYCISPDS